MAWRIKLRQPRNHMKIRDGRGFAGRSKRLFTDKWVRFENLPTVEDPNLIIEKIEKVPIINRQKVEAPPVVKKKTRKRKTAAKTPPPPPENVD